MRRRGFYFYFDFPFGIGIRRGPFFRAFCEPWRFPRREEYLRMLEEYKRDLEDYKREIEGGAARGRARARRAAQRE
jgi:hypothetical protein